MSIVDLDAFRWLLTEPGQALLIRATELYVDHDGDPVGTATALRRGQPEPARAAAALTQVDLRARAVAKLGADAVRMYFTPDGLEQATRLSVAAHHARRFVGAGCRRVVDLGCGLGSDAMAFAGLDLGVLAYDADELTAALATVNLRHWPDVQVRCADVIALDLDDVLEPGDGVWLDPARRTGGRGGSRRTFDPEAFSPPYSFVLDVASRVPATGAKLAPGIAHRLLPPDAEAQWVSVGGDVVECALWCGPLAREGVRRSALLLDGAGGAHELTAGQTSPAPVGPVGSWLHEPDGAVIRAGLVGEVARELGGTLLDPTIAYISTAHPAATPFARSYAVEDVLPFSLKRLRGYLRDRGVGTLTVKKRGSAVDPDQLRRQLKLSGDASATIALTRVDGRPHVLVLRLVP
jgi:THUMP domain-containing protein